MKVVLVDNLILPEAGSTAAMDVHPHLGLLALAAVAGQAGHAVSIFDPKRAVRDGVLAYDGGIYDRAADLLLAMEPDVVGFTALGCSFLFAVNVARALKRRAGGLPVLLGGPHATMLHREILARYPQFDVIVRYEADATFPLVLERLADRRFDEVPGISWRAPDGALRYSDGAPKVEDLDGLPRTDYDHYPVATLGLDLLRIEAGRGCPFACTFCSTAGFFQRSFRLKSPGRLVAELDALHARYGYRDFKLDHDMFTANRKKVLAFCDAVADRGYRWSVSARVDCVDEILLERMRQAGCVNLYFGIETGSQRMQAVARKKLDLALVEPRLARADALGIETTASFITGFPEETGEDLDQTLDLLGRCARRASCLVQLHLLAPEPGTSLFARDGGSIRYDGVAGPYHCGLLAPGDEDEILAAPAIFQTYYHYPSLLDRGRSLRAVDIVDLLRRTGATIFDYVLRFFEGRLSVLARSAEAFAAAGELSRFDVPAFIAFAVDRFGPGHHVVSLLRFALHGGGAAGQTASVRAPEDFDPDAIHGVAPGLRVLDTMHDCAALLDRVRALPRCGTLADEPRAATRTYLLVSAGGGATAYLTETGVADVLGLFERPAAPTSVLHGLGMAAGAEFDRGLAGIAALAAAGLIRARPGGAAGPTAAHG